MTSSPLKPGSPIKGKYIHILLEANFPHILQAMRFFVYLREAGAVLSFSFKPVADERLIPYIEPYLRLLFPQSPVYGDPTEASDSDYRANSRDIPAFCQASEPLLPLPAPAPVPADVLDRWARLLNVTQGPLVAVAVEPDQNGEAVNTAALDKISSLLAGYGRGVILPGPGHANNPGGLQQDSRVLDPLSLKQDKTDFTLVDVAAIIELCAFSIMAGAELVHLAGNQLKETWLCLSNKPDAFWGQAGSAHPWYPGLRLFRQNISALSGDIISNQALSDMRQLLALRQKAADPTTCTPDPQGSWIGPTAPFQLPERLTAFLTAQLKQEMSASLRQEFFRLLAILAASRKLHDAAANWFDLAEQAGTAPGLIASYRARLAQEAGKADIALQCLQKTALKAAEGQQTDSGLDKIALHLARHFLAENQDKSASTALEIGRTFALNRQDFAKETSELLTQTGRLDGRPLFANEYLHHLQTTGDYEGTVAYLDQLLKDENSLDPHALRAVRAQALRYLGQHDQAEKDIRQALQTKPTHAGLLLELGHLEIYNGDWINGFRHTAQLWRPGSGIQSTAATRFLARHQDRILHPGKKLAGKNQHLLILLRHGYGNMIQYLRYIPLLIKSGMQVTINLAPAYQPIRSYIETLAPQAKLVLSNSPDDLPDFDAICVLEMLPAWFEATPQNVPPPVYVPPDPARIAFWKDYLAAYPGPKIAFTVGGDRVNHNDQLRSIPLCVYHQAFKTYGWLINLQTGLFPEDVTYLQENPDIIDPMNQRQEPAKAALNTKDALNTSAQIKDFRDSAALLEAVDLVLCVDSGLAHLAGHQGKETWVMLYEPAEYRWMAARADCPWYPALRLFRQKQRLPGNRGDWTPVIADIQSELAKKFSIAQMEAENV